jgi:hypothetical protein
VDRTSEDEFCGSLREEILKNNKIKTKKIDLPMTYMKFLRWVSRSDTFRKSMPMKPSNLENLNELTKLEENVIWFESKSTEIKRWRKHTG